ncbi:tripartite-type tricarboxylate transporter receptor subunit TctC [Variovorax boronicumulans]|uniref:Bug family tripartite tricarboxylate transporter substrate binding protein n=1 Tax=Variovorax boronicumulans TaxID=436515 RepID=UPI00278B81DA|nr:tripartite tricarboxylate transporter substrate-binding protein [Variovorax boronicumulans]MDQ0038500.1 tripartite-type tricarboxylate transporter receptor subunit TctC [Variovorax boronicumulans]
MSATPTSHSTSFVRTLGRVVATTLLSSVLFSVAHGQENAYPGKTINLVVPFPAGGSTDAAARLVSTHMAKILGQAITVENIGGASGAIAAQKVVRSNADGYSLLAGTINDVVLAPIVNKGTSYKYQDLASIGLIGTTPFVLVANPKVPAANIDELLAYVRSKPGTVNVGIPGVGTLQHIGTALLAARAKIEWTTVPYKGAAPLNVDLLGGQIDLAVVTLPSAIQYINEGRFKSMGLMSSQRDQSYPKISTINEGHEIKNVSTDAWIGIFAPAKTAPAVVQRLNAALTETMQKAEVREGLAKLGYRAAEGSSTAQFSQFVASEDARYKGVARSVNLDR